MKRCPSCQRTFPDDAPDFCPNDGMRLVNEDAATFDPEKTVMHMDVIAETPTELPTPTAPPAGPPPTPTPQMQSPPPPQAQPTSQQWQPQAGNQPQQQAAWPAAPQAQQSQAAPIWNNSPYQQQPAAAPYGAQFAQPSFSGKSRAIAIAALVFGVDAATIMSFAVIRDRDYLRILLYALPILAIALGLTSLLLSLKKPSRFGGVELAIAGLALGAAGLVFILMRSF